MNKSNKLPATYDPRCGTTAGYHRHKNRKEYYCDLCKVANAASSKVWRDNNSDRYKDKARLSYQRHSDKRKAETAERRKKLGPEIISTQNKTWRENNREYIRDKKRIDSNKRRARRNQVAHEPYTAKQVLELWGSNCHICNEPIDLEAPRGTGLPGWERGLHLDHVVPIAKGGNDVLANIKPAHGICNLRKNAY